MESENFFHNKGYVETWNIYKTSVHYHNALICLTEKGFAVDYVDQMLEHAFNAGWSLLISTFINNISESEKKFPKTLSQPV